MAKPRVAINKLVLEIDGRTIELSMAQAEELREVLNEALGKRIVVEPHVVIERPYWPWYDHSTWPTKHWSISYNNTTGSLIAGLTSGDQPL